MPFGSLFPPDVARRATAGMGFFVIFSPLAILEKDS
jgi:hypothetical protein